MGRTMLFPQGVSIDPVTGAVSPSTGSYVKRVAELGGIYRDRQAHAQELASKGDIVAYEVIEYRLPQSDLAFGTTIMSPGKIGEEYFMTRGHFHVRRECGEVYYTQSGQGLLLLESREGEVRSGRLPDGVLQALTQVCRWRVADRGEVPAASGLHSTELALAFEYAGAVRANRNGSPA